MKKVSIIIPVYNGSNYMKEAIDSALNQTYSNIEVLVINDGSNDQGKTRDIALSYGNKIRYFEKENGGVSTALNLGVMNMRGEYFSWLSHDDIYYSNKIEEQILALQGSVDQTLPVYSGWKSLQMPQNVAIEYKRSVKRYNANFFTSGLLAVTMGFISGCSLLIHKSYFKKYGLFDEKLRTTQDYTKWFQMFKDKKIIYINKPLIISRIHNEQTGATYRNYKQECDTLHLWMMENINISDLINTGMDRYCFFSIMLNRFEIMEYNKAYNYVYHKLIELDEPKDTEKKISKLKKLINKRNLKMYIQCAGIRGRALLSSLELRGFYIEGFCDSNKNLWGKIINNKNVFSPAQIDKKNSMIIVSKADPENLKIYLLKQGFENVITYDEITESLCKVPIKKAFL